MHLAVVRREDDRKNRIYDAIRSGVKEQAEGGTLH